MMSSSTINTDSPVSLSGAIPRDLLVPADMLWYVPLTQTYGTFSMATGTYMTTPTKQQ